jgi:hypothetical protein
MAASAAVEVTALPRLLCLSGLPQYFAHTGHRAGEVFMLQKQKTSAN